MRNLFVVLFGLVALAATCAVAAPVTYGTSGATYSQNFDTLITSGTNQPWANETTLTGWSLFRVTGAADPTPVAITAYNAGTGSSNAGSFYSFGATSSTERSLGGVGSGGAYFGTVTAANATIGWIAVALQNTVGDNLYSPTISFDGEQWRDGGAATPAAQPMALEYGFGSTFSTVATWTAPGGNFDWSSPVFTNTAAGAAVDGNVAGKVANRGGTLSGLVWAPNTTLWIRWVERNDAGNDHGMSVDNFTLAAAVPEAGSFLFAGLACCASGGIAFFRSRRARRA